MSAHGIAGGSIVWSSVVILCRCGERCHGRGGAASLAAYRLHRALVTQTVTRRPPARPAATVLQFTKGG